MFTTETPIISAGFDVISVSKYLNLTLSTKVGSATRRPTTNASVISAVQGLVSIFLITLLFIGRVRAFYSVISHKIAHTIHLTTA